MKRLLIILVVSTVFVSLGWASYQANSPANQPLAKYVPAGALLSLEAEDFSSLLQDWNSSQQKKHWLQSSNYEVFSRSRLFLRLKGASDQFAAAAGLPPDMNFLGQVAGGHSMMAIYDIGNLQFLYITYLPSAQSMETKLWQTRSKFEPRNVGGKDFYVRRDLESQREVAFAVVGDYLLLATRQDVMAGALQLMGGGKDRSIENEAWWSQSKAASGSEGDLRMVLNMEKIVPSPYFRTYWVQQNITDLKQYSSAVTDLFRSATQYREEHVLLRKPSTEASPSEAETAAAADLMRFVPNSSGIYEAKAKPTADACFDLLVSKLLAPHFGVAPASQLAPPSPQDLATAGSDLELETRIDQPLIKSPATGQAPSELQILLQKTHILASLQVHSTELGKNGVFVNIHSGLALRADSDWDETNVRNALTDFVRPYLTAGQFGIVWQQKAGYRQLDGLWPLVAAVRGKYLLVADNPALIEAMLAKVDQPSDIKPAVFLAGFDHKKNAPIFFVSPA